MIHESTDLERAKMNLETAQIAWHELQRFFASGAAIWVAPDLDLVEVAQLFAQDQAHRIKTWLDQGSIAKVSDAQAQLWFHENTLVWAIVVKPWILVQDPAKSSVNASTLDHT